MSQGVLFFALSVSQEGQFARPVPGRLPHSAARLALIEGRGGALRSENAAARASCARVWENTHKQDDWDLSGEAEPRTGPSAGGDPAPRHDLWPAPTGRDPARTHSGGPPGRKTAEEVRTSLRMLVSPGVGPRAATARCTQGNESILPVAFEPQRFMTTACPDVPRLPLRGAPGTRT
jgi:hypothetical protein